MPAELGRWHRPTTLVGQPSPTWLGHLGRRPSPVGARHVVACPPSHCHCRRQVLAHREGVSAGQQSGDAVGDGPQPGAASTLTAVSCAHRQPRTSGPRLSPGPGGGGRLDPDVVPTYGDRSSVEVRRQLGARTFPRRCDT